MPKYLIILLIAVPMIFLGIVLALRSADSKNKALQQAPGYTLVYPNGVLLHTDKTSSVLGAGGAITRVYGVTVSTEEIRSYFREQLTALGYKQTDAIGDQYAQGQFRFELSADAPNQRIYGKHYDNAGYRSILFVRLTNSK